MKLRVEPAASIVVVVDLGPHQVRRVLQLLGNIRGLHPLLHSSYLDTRSRLCSETEAGWPQGDDAIHSVPCHM